MRSMSCTPLPFSFSASSAHRHRHRHQCSAHPPPISRQETCTSSSDLDQKRPTSKPKTIRFRLNQLCIQGHVHLARQLFDEIPNPSTVLWNTIIIGYICNGMPHEALSLYSLRYCSLNCDAYTYSSILKACAETKQFLIGKVLHCHVLRSSVHSSKIVYNSLLNLYTACLPSSPIDTKSDFVERVFRTMPKRNVVSYNTMISWYTKSGRFSEALRHWLMMMKRSLRPTVVSFVNVFPAVSGLGAMEIAGALYGMVIKLGDEYVREKFVVSSAITMFSELGCLDVARKIFDNCFDKNAHVWNTMIGGYVQNNCLIDALELFREALEAQDGTGGIDDVTFLLAISAASELHDLDVARQLHSYMVKCSLVSSVILLNAIVSLYSKCNSVSEAFNVFSEMSERDVVSWNTMICSLVQNGLDDEGLLLVHEMQKSGFKIDDVTITALLSAASNLRNQEIGKQIHAYMIRHEIRFDGMESYLIDMYSKSGSMLCAETIFTRSCKDNNDVAVWNAMISGSTQNGLVEESLVIFRQMVDENVQPNAVTLASILPACSQLGNISLGKQLHGFSIRNFLERNVFVSSALIDMYSKSGSIIYAERVFEESIEKNSVTFTNMILGYAQHGMSGKAFVLFRSMRERGINPDAITFVALLSACSYTGLVDEGLEFFESMERDFGIRPSTEHYACIVDLLGRVGRVDEAYNVARKLGDNGNAYRIWGSLLSACKTHNEFELGKVVADKLLEMEGAGRIAGYRVLLSNIHAEEGNWEYVKNVRKEMLERGLTKEIGCSWINVPGHSSCFVSRDVNHPRCDEIYRLLKQLAANSKDSDYTPQVIELQAP
ncbi:pentatricopeptide repeat-containing protein At3g22150, chloroplastic [Andrographis paniculata]|uniref:pentatricopeptide repeat-containing protein At3g22150, chloroplastic n=1 Tax=Andrographis paniculata TaxID=175694 RepID=UPI0021E92338|nr:pentatricopeptide repeat-containing protein At3g22150, chloroplastic [Andrographis paniculata]